VEIATALRKYREEAPEKVADLTPWDIGHVLERFVEEEVTTQEVRDWARIIESCGDIRFVSDEVSAAIRWLTNPSVEGALTEDAAYRFIHALPSYRCRASLRIIHPTIDPREITLANGLTPRFSCQVGKLRVSPKGRPLEGIWESSNWVAELAAGEPPACTLSAALTNALEQVSSRGDFFHRMRSEGAKVEFYVGWHFYRGNTGEAFDSVLLGRMAELGIQLSLDVYSP